MVDRVNSAEDVQLQEKECCEYDEQHDEDIEVVDECCIEVIFESKKGGFFLVLVHFRL